MIEVNEYVRTDEGEIAKVTSVAKETLGETLGIDEYRDIGFCNTEPYVKGNIIKHSKQLIDLIECGDYVNGMEVLDIHKPRDLWEPIEIRVDSRYTNFILAKDIKTILTKERYMANCYKVGGKQWD